MNTIRTISVAELKSLLDADPRLPILDVRTSSEYDSVRTAFATLAPLESLDPHRARERAGGSSDATLYLLCATGARARIAYNRFLNDGFTNVAVVDGGLNAWQAAGFQVIREGATISLERQVRIAAGSLVVLGVALGLTVHPVFHGISAFVGGGLVYAGITDTCRMALLLARMPWNHRSVRMSLDW